MLCTDIYPVREKPVAQHGSVEDLLMQQGEKMHQNGDAEFIRAFDTI